MDSDISQSKELSLVERFRKSWFPPAAVAGAFAAFVTAAFRVRPTPKPAPPKPAPASKPKPFELEVLQAPPLRLEREYRLLAEIGGAASAHPFRRSLKGVAIGGVDRIYALGDDEVRIFGPEGEPYVGGWKVPEGIACLAVDANLRTYLGSLGRVDIYDAKGAHVGGFSVGETGKPASVTSVKVYKDEVLAADASSRLIRRHDLRGKQIGTIGTTSKTSGFMLPNGWLDIDVDSKGTVYATDTGRHKVTAWSIEGSLLGSFGKFGMSDPADFVGCCNPVNLAASPDGKIVTGEKMVARVKVYEAGGRLLAVIGPENFDPACTHIHLAVDSKGRILAADPVRREIKLFGPVTKPENRNS